MRISIVSRYRLRPLHSFSLDGTTILPPVAADAIDEERSEILDRYFHDIYTVFASKLTRFALDPAAPFGETEKLKELLDELIRTKSLLEKASGEE